MTRPEEFVKYLKTPVSPCCNAAQACVFSKALVARAASCELSERTCVGEQDVVACTSPAARAKCGTLAALLHDQARSVLRLPPPGRPLIHVHALKLQCSGLSALQHLMVSADGDVHRLVTRAQDEHGSLSDLPWPSLVSAIADWQPRARGPRQAPGSAATESAG